MRLCELAEYAEIEKIARDEFPDVPDRCWEGVADLDVDDPELGIDAKTVAQLALSWFATELNDRLARMPNCSETDRPTLNPPGQIATLNRVVKT